MTEQPPLPVPAGNILITNAHIFDPAEGLDMKGADLLIIDGVIRDIALTIDAPLGVETINAKGHLLLPGLIDCDFVDYDPISALYGGITTLVTGKNTATNSDNYDQVMGPRLHCHANHQIERPILASETGLALAGDTANRMGLEGIAVDAETNFLKQFPPKATTLLGPMSSYFGLDHLRHMQDDGLIALTHPAYFSLNELAIVGYDTRAKFFPPLRLDFDRQGVIDALNDGTIKIIASGHVKTTRDDKSLPFAQAKAGMPAQTSMLTMLLELTNTGASDLNSLLPLVTTNPANHFDLPQGRLKAGTPGDVILVDPTKPHRLLANHSRQGHRQEDIVCPLDRRPVQGCVIKTIINGHTVFERT